MSQLSYIARIVRSEPTSWLHTELEIRQVGSSAVHGLECRALLLNPFGVRYVLDAQTVSDIPVGGVRTLMFGDWTDQIGVLMEVRYADDKARCIDFLKFDWRDMPAEVGATCAAVIHEVDAAYLSFVESRWFDYLPAEALAPVIRHFRYGTVLVLGKDSGEGLKRLNVISELLGNKGFEPVLLKQMDDIRGQSLEEKLLSVALLSRFVVVDDSEPSGHIAELVLLTRSRVLTAILRLGGHGGTFMQADYDVDFGHFVRSFTYQINSLDGCIDEVVNWADQVALDRAAAYQRLYPWRK